MSQGSRFAIGLVAGLLGILIFVATLNDPAAEGPSPAARFGMSAFALCVATACFFRSSLPVTLRIIGAVVCVFAGWFAYSILAGEKARPGALPFAILLAGGGAWLAVTGKYPSWAAHGSAFQKIEESNRRRMEQEDSTVHGDPSDP
jgi:hypothetical protein